MIKYEYNAINNPQFLGDRLLNRLGEDGWELVSHAYNSNTCDHFYTFKRMKIEVIPSLSDEEIMEMNQKEYERDLEVGVDRVARKFKLDDSFKKALEEAVISDTPASSWMDEYRESYDKLLASGMFFEFNPTWTGEWDKDKYAFCYNKGWEKNK